MRSFHVASQRKFAWSSWRGSGQVLLFTYSLLAKLALGLRLVFRNFIQRRPSRPGLRVVDDLKATSSPSTSFLLCPSHLYVNKTAPGAREVSLSLAKG